MWCLAYGTLHLQPRLIGYNRDAQFSGDDGKGIKRDH